MRCKIRVSELNSRWRSGNPTHNISGMPLGAKSQSTEIWNGVIEKCEKKLARWKTQYLSRGDRLTLINSVVDSLPAYMMSAFPIPARVINRLDKMTRYGRSFFGKGIVKGMDTAWSNGRL